MLDQLYYFTEVYRHRSISRASDFLHISRQALSHSIKVLENELGVELFTRLKDGVLPTKAADSLYESAQTILNEEAVIKKNMLAFRQNESNARQYSVCAPMAYVNYCGEALVSHLSKKFPREMFVLSTIKNSDDTCISQKDINIQSKLSKQTRRSMHVPADYECDEFLRLPIYIWVHESHPLAHTEDISYAMLRMYPASVLKSTYNGTEFSSLLNLGYDPIVEVPSNLKDNLRRFGHYTIDFGMREGRLMLDELFKDDSEIIKMETLESIYLYMIYKKSVRKGIADNIRTFVSHSLQSQK